MKKRLFFYMIAFAVMSIMPLTLRYIFQKHDSGVPALLYLTSIIILNLLLSNYLLEQRIWIRFLIGIGISFSTVIGVYQLGKIDALNFLHDYSNYIAIFMIIGFVNVVLQELSVRTLRKQTND